MRLITILSTCLLSIGFLAAEEQVVVAGIRLVGPAYGEGEDLRAFNHPQGTVVSLLVLRKEGGIIELDEDKSKLQTAVDSRNQDLTKPAPGGGGSSRGGFGSWPDVARDGTAAMVEVELPRLPSPGSTAIGIIGSVHLLIGDQPTPAKAEGVAYQTVDTTFKAGEVAFTVKRFEKDDWGDKKGCSVSLETTHSFDRVASVKFMAGGREIESANNSTGTSSVSGKVTICRTYSLEETPDKVDVVITYYQRAKGIDVPIKVKAGLDLGLKQ